ncbi:MAG: hypothetical protein ACOCRK_07335, partial [bacterium]
MNKDIVGSVLSDFLTGREVGLGKLNIAKRKSDKRIKEMEKKGIYLTPKQRIAHEKNVTAVWLFFFSIIGGIINYLIAGGENKWGVIAGLVFVGLTGSLFMTTLIVKVIISQINMIPFYTFLVIIGHMGFVVWQDPQLSSIYLMFYNLVLMAFYLNSTYIVLTYIVQACLLRFYQLLYGESMFGNLTDINGYLKINNYILLTSGLCILLCALGTKQNREVKAKHKVDDINEKISTILKKVRDAIVTLTTIAKDVDRNIIVVDDNAKALNLRFNEIGKCMENEVESVIGIQYNVRNNTENISRTVEDTKHMNNLALKTKDSTDKGYTEVKNLINQTKNITEVTNSINKALNNLSEPPITKVTGFLFISLCL